MAVIERSTTCSSETRVCSSIIDAILIALPSTVESNWKSIAQTRWRAARSRSHRKGLLHRDVKPANIIVADLDTDEQRVLLADLGIARPVDDISGITATNMPVGSVAYAAPEQLMGEQMDGRADHADDLYAVVADKLDIGQCGLGAQGWPHAATDSTTDS